MSPSDTTSPTIQYAREVDRPDRAVIATDAAGIVVYWGAGAEALYGWAEHEVLGRDILAVTPADLSRDDAARVMATLAGGDPWSGEFLVRTRDGQRFLASVTDIPVRDDAGRLAGIVGISRRSTYLGEVAPLESTLPRLSPRRRRR